MSATTVDKPKVMGWNPAIRYIIYLFLDTLSLFLFFKTKKTAIFRKNLRIFWSAVSIFLKSYPFSDLTEWNQHFSMFFRKLKKYSPFAKIKAEKKFKFKNRSKTATNIVKSCNSFQFRGMIFSITLISLCQELCFYFENTSIGTCRSVIPRLTKYREVQLVMNFLHVETHISRKL